MKGVGTHKVYRYTRSTLRTVRYAPVDGWKKFTCQLQNHGKSGGKWYTREYIEIWEKLFHRHETKYPVVLFMPTTVDIVFSVLSSTVFVFVSIHLYWQSARFLTLINNFCFRLYPTMANVMKSGPITDHGATAIGFIESQDDGRAFLCNLCANNGIWRHCAALRSCHKASNL